MRGQLVLLLDCDNSRLSIKLPSLLGNVDAIVIAVSNDDNKLPTLKNKRIGEVVPRYENAADFRIVARIATVMVLNPVSDVVLVSRDRALARAIQEWVNLHHIPCYRYSNITDAMASPRLQELIESGHRIR